MKGADKIPMRLDVLTSITTCTAVMHLIGGVDDRRVKDPGIAVKDTRLRLYAHPLINMHAVTTTGLSRTVQEGGITPWLVPKAVSRPSRYRGNQSAPLALSNVRIERCWLPNAYLT